LLGPDFDLRRSNGVVSNVGLVLCSNAEVSDGIGVVVLEAIVVGLVVGVHHSFRGEKPDFVSDIGVRGGGKEHSVVLKIDGNIVVIEVSIVMELSKRGTPLVGCAARSLSSNKGKGNSQEN